MKMIHAIVRPERERHVVRALEDLGVFALTKIPITGRGRQGGLQVASLTYSELAKVMFIIVLPTEQSEAAITAISRAAYTGYPGDGRIFILPVDKSVRLRTGEIQDGITKPKEAAS